MECLWYFTVKIVYSDITVKVCYYSILNFLQVYYGFPKHHNVNPNLNEF